MIARRTRSTNQISLIRQSEASLKIVIRYVAFLRGINVGGKKLIKMEELRRVIEQAGLKNVGTFIASRNLIFDTSETNLEAITAKIEKKLDKALELGVLMV